LRRRIRQGRHRKSRRKARFSLQRETEIVDKTRAIDDSLIDPINTLSLHNYTVTASTRGIPKVATEKICGENFSPSLCNEEKFSALVTLENFEGKSNLVVKNLPVMSEKSKLE
jgi:hypothetical protein